jgi:hypothetical protein
MQCGSRVVALIFFALEQMLSAMLANQLLQAAKEAETAPGTQAR